MATTPAPSADPLDVTFYTDGLCEPNPAGVACWAWIAVSGGRELAHDQGTIGQGAGMTNNIAEYEAVIKALEHARSQGWQGVRICCDSQLVVNQIAGRWAVNAPGLVELHAWAKQLGRELHATIRWIPRGENVPCDALTRQAYRAATQMMRRAA